MFLGLSTNLIRIHEVIAPHQEMSSLQQSSSPSALICSSLGRRKILDGHLTDSKHLVKWMLFVLPVSFWKTSDVSGCPTHAWFPQNETCTSPKKHTFSKPMVSKPMVASPFFGGKDVASCFPTLWFPPGPLTRRSPTCCLWVKRWRWWIFPGVGWVPRRAKWMYPYRIHGAGIYIYMYIC